MQTLTCRPASFRLGKCSSTVRRMYPHFGSCLTCFLRLGSHTGRLESNSASHSALSSAALSASLFFVFKHKLDRVGDSNSISIVCYARCLRSNSCFPLPSNNRSGAKINVFARIFDHRKNKRSAAFIRTPRVGGPAREREREGRREK